MYVCVCPCMHWRMLWIWREKRRMIMRLCLCVCVYVSVYIFMWEWRWGVLLSEVAASVFSSGSLSGVCGRWGGGMVVVILGRAAVIRAEQCNGLEQSGTAGGCLIGPARPGPQNLPKWKGIAPVQTRELVALFLCQRAVRPGLQQCATSSRPRSDTVRIHNKAMNPPLFGVFFFFFW